MSHTHFCGNCLFDHKHLVKSGGNKWRELGDSRETAFYPGSVQGDEAAVYIRLDRVPSQYRLAAELFAKRRFAKVSLP